MYRFTIDNAEWIITFSPHLKMETEERELIVKSLLQMGPDLQEFTHGASFVIFINEIGLTVLRVEKIPSLILTVSSIVTKDKWYKRGGKSVKRYYEN